MQQLYQGAVMCLSLILALALLFQGMPTRHSDGLKLLNEIARRYATATTSYHIEAVKEQSFAAVNGLQRSWEKMLLSARAMPGGRYRYEGHTGGRMGDRRIRRNHELGISPQRASLYPEANLAQ
jgi:hypothetical protein